MSDPHLSSRAAEVLDTLRAEILTGQYRPGERLPSERELAARFETSRGAVREALKKLEQLGIAAIHPGGVRVRPIEEATLEVIGPLLDLQDVPDMDLADQVLKVMSLLVIESARDFMAIADDDQIAHAQALVDAILATEVGTPESMEARLELGRYFMTASGNLPMRLIANGLRIHFAERLQARNLGPAVDTAAFGNAMKSFKKALGSRDAEGVSATMREMMDLNRRGLRAALEAAGASCRGLDLLPAAPSRGLRR